MTYADTVAKCASMDLVLCGQSCRNSGCQYNKNPVYSGLPCPFMRAPFSPPPLPPPSSPPSLPSRLSIPTSGIAILAGDAANVEPLFCLWPGDESVTSSVGQEPSREMPQTDIAAQCCASNQRVAKDCRRRAHADGTSSDSNSDCVVGFRKGSTDTFVAMTYADTVALCASMDLVLCGQSCSGMGCFYNFHPVFSSVPCDDASVAPALSATKLP